MSLSRAENDFENVMKEREKRQICESLISHDDDNDMMIPYDDDNDLSLYFCGFVKRNCSKRSNLVRQIQFIPITFMFLLSLCCV